MDGATDRNLKVLCRAIVQRNWGRYGTLRSLRNQPGVEFHLKLHTACDLGDPGRWFGWQCRWYDLTSDNGFRSTQQESIKKAIVKTREHVPGITDFVLVLRRLPSKSSEQWYHDLDAGDLRLHLWADEALEGYLTGPAAIVRSTFFDELVVTAEALADAHSRSVGPVRERWLPEVNVVTRVERELHAALLRPGSTSPLREQGERLQSQATKLRDGNASVRAADCVAVSELADTLTDLGASLLAINEAVVDHRPDAARELLAKDAKPVITVAAVRTLARHLRTQNIPAALIASGAVGEISRALSQLSMLRTLVDAPSVAVVAAAGRGKSHLAAGLTAPGDDWPAGVFIRGSELHAAGTLDELACRVPGFTVASFEELIEAVDAAGSRLGARIPVVIDGLNEAERPSRWRQLLAEFVPAARCFPNAMVLITVRPEAIDEVLVADVHRIDLEWDSGEVADLVARYFAHYAIDPGNARLPLYAFADPLFLRMFCDAVNPDRDPPVGVESIPGDLVAGYELYRSRALRRLTTELGRSPGYLPRKLGLIAKELWDRKARELPFEELQQIIKEPETEWQQSAIRALEQEGILFRSGGVGPNDQRSAVLFDRFGGYLIADALLGGLSPDDAIVFLASEALWARLTTGSDDHHPLGTDIFRALVGLVPRRFHQRHLWTFAPDHFRRAALLETVELSSELLDEDTVRELAVLIRSYGRPQSFYLGPYDRLWELRDGVQHRLNAKFLDEVLRAMSVAERDASWTEWVRARADDLQVDLDVAEADWTERDARDDADGLRARAIAWMTTSTNRELRDRATRALQRFGRTEPRSLFELTVDLLDVNDPYVWERALAASFGAAADHQFPDPGGAFERALTGLLAVLAERFLGPGATNPTSHQLARQYIEALFEFAHALHPTALPAGIGPTPLDHAPGPVPESLATDDDGGAEVDATCMMDFTNYTVGGLYESRSNYQFDHPEHNSGMAQIRGRIWEIGWRADQLAELDSSIAEREWRGRRSDDDTRTERYGKKYGWIAYYELAGRLIDDGQRARRDWTQGRGVWPDIDPSFVESLTAADVPAPQWASTGPTDPERWLTSGEVIVTEALLRPPALGGEAGPWILVEGYLQHRSPTRRRRVFAFLRGALVAANDGAALAELFATEEYLGNDFIPGVPSDHTTYAGEIPWSTRFAKRGDLENDLPPYRAHVGQWFPDAAPRIEIELVAQQYAFEGQTGLREVASAHVPSSSVSAEFGLRRRPRCLDLVSRDGRPASMTRAAPGDLDGHLLYVRKDLLDVYSNGRRFVHLCWGEREVDIAWDDPPPWRRRIGSYAGLWRQFEIVD